jgi:hypothetical protein
VCSQVDRIADHAKEVGWPDEYVEFYETFSQSFGLREYEDG